MKRNQLFFLGNYLFDPMTVVVKSLRYFLIYVNINLHFICNIANTDYWIK